MIKLTLYGKNINDKVNCKLIQKEVELLFNAVIDRYINKTIKRKRGKKCLMKINVILVTEIELGTGNVWKLPVRLDEQDKQFPVDGMFSQVTIIPEDN